MSRLVLAAVAVAVALLGGYFIGVAADDVVADHILITRNGVTLDCKRVTDVIGQTFYDSCVRVP